MKFYLGAQKPSWLGFVDVPLFLMRQRMEKRKSFPRALTSWCLDSGGFNILRTRGRWHIGVEQYADEVEAWSELIGKMDWAAPMDWMCEPYVLATTGLSVWDHQKRTVVNFLKLRRRLGNKVIPVLQGWTIREYIRCIRLYERAGIDLTAERVVGVGSVCRKNSHDVIVDTLSAIASEIGPRLHGFGVKGSVLRTCQDILVSADSLAWSLEARYKREPMPICTHVHCGGCLPYALLWRDRLLRSLP